MPDPARTDPIRVDVVSDVVCPWCFIGKKRLEQAIALNPDIPVEVHYHPYFLNDWIPAEGISREQYLTKKFGSPERYKEIATRVSAAAAQDGLVYAIDKLSRQPNTTDSHRLIHWAEQIGKAPQMKQRLMELYFSEGADLSDKVGAGRRPPPISASMRMRSRRNSHRTTTSRSSRSASSRPSPAASRACRSSSSTMPMRYPARRRRSNWRT